MRPHPPFSFLIASLLCLTPITVGVSTASATVPENATVSVLNAMPLGSEAEVVDIYKDNVLLIENLTRGTLQTLTLPAGKYDFSVYADGVTPPATAIASAPEVEVFPGDNFTLTANFDDTGSPALNYFFNDMSEIDPGKTRLTVRHVAAAPPLDLGINGLTLPLELPNLGEFIFEVPTETYTFDFVLAGTEFVVIDPTDIVLAESTNTVLYAWGPVTEISLALATQVITGLDVTPECDVTNFGGGAGTPSEPLIINNAAHLTYLSSRKNCWEYSYLQTSNINLTAEWTPIGDSDLAFTGSYDGGGYTISGLEINSPLTSNIGLFGIVTGPITSVNVAGSVIGEEQTGGLVGWLNNGTITDSSSSVTVTGSYYTGGLVGLVTSSVGITAISNSSATGNISGSGGNIGGLIGAVHNGNVAGSWATGNVSADGQIIGGLIGILWGGDLDDSFATGDVVGFESVGGLVGQLANNTQKPTITRSYARGDVSAPSGFGWHFGGLVGIILRGNVVFSYSTGNSSGYSRVGGFIGESDALSFGGFEGVTVENSYSSGTASGTAPDTTFLGPFIGRERPITLVTDSGVRTSGELQAASTFVGWDISPYWNGGATWAICSSYNGGFPYLVDTVSTNPSGCALAPVPPPVPVPGQAASAAPTPNPSATVTSGTPTVPVFQKNVRPLAPGFSAITGDVIAVTVPIRSSAPASTKPKNAPKVVAKTGEIIRVSIDGLTPTSDVVVAIRINGRWMRLGTASTGVKGRTTLPAFQTSVPGDYLMRIRGNGAEEHYVTVSVDYFPPRNAMVTASFSSGDRSISDTPPTIDLR